ncbi:MAG: histidine triad nucleotide-binding protein [Candidatus Sedimenticola sp. PURPLELP]
MEECLFCKMASGEIVPEVVFEDEEVLAFRDINPQAPVHVVIIPKRHIATLNDIGRVDAGLIGKLYLAATDVARQEGIAGTGYRTVFNCNRDGGQEVFHLHLHLIGGRQMKWPPG